MSQAASAGASLGANSGGMQDHPSLSEAEVEFLAEDEVVGIVPNFSTQEPMPLICGAVGPFRAAMGIEVPLWLAVALKKRQKCSIQTPAWMSVDSLTRILEDERSSDAFQPLPYHYVEIAALLFHANEHGRDIPDAYKVRTLIQDIRDVRQSKIEDGLKKLSAATTAVKLSNLSAMEVTLVRPFLCKSLAHLQKLDKAIAAQSTATATDSESMPTL